MRIAFQTLGILVSMAALLVPMILFAAADKPVLIVTPERRYERDGNKIVEKVKDRSASKGTNTVYRTGRSFPLMFSAPRDKSKKGHK